MPASASGKLSDPIFITHKNFKNPAIATQNSAQESTTTMNEFQLQLNTQMIHLLGTDTANLFCNGAVDTDCLCLQNIPGRHWKRGLHSSICSANTLFFWDWDWDVGGIERCWCRKFIFCYCVFSVLQLTQMHTHNICGFTCVLNILVHVHLYKCNYTNAHIMQIANLHNPLPGRSKTKLI